MIADLIRYLRHDIAFREARRGSPERDKANTAMEEIDRQLSTREREVAEAVQDLRDKLAHCEKSLRTAYRSNDGLRRRIKALEQERDEALAAAEHYPRLIP